ncbi:stress response protein NST1-like [Lactuca sativa]|uniref:stress response protein NST1-like n=1 Tax=Lactuca sativa TaxID=4236 RepID=UPI000CD889A7|nr:stress response protein NST1-like [Lactuca sativa]
MDFKSAFLNGELKEVYLQQPIAFENLCLPNHYYKLMKALSGLKQAPHTGYETLPKLLEDFGFIKGVVDPTLFRRSNQKLLMLVKQSLQGTFLHQENSTSELLKKYSKDNYASSKKKTLHDIMEKREKERKEWVVVEKKSKEEKKKATEEIARIKALTEELLKKKAEEARKSLQQP